MIIKKCAHYLYDIIRYRIFASYTSLLYSIDSYEYTAKYYGDVRRVTLDNVNDANTFQNEKYLQCFKTFLEAGDDGYYGYLDGKCAHRSWVVHSGMMVVDRYYQRPMKENEIFIHWCETAVWARGHNLYPAILGRIIADNPDRHICISVNENNIASRRGVEKVGFAVQERIETKVVFGMKFTSIEDINANVRGGGDRCLNDWRIPLMVDFAWNGEAA